MNLSQFILKNFFENICKKGRFWVITLTFQVRAMSPNIIFFKLRLYMPQICGVAKKSKTF